VGYIDQDKRAVVFPDGDVTVMVVFSKKKKEVSETP